MTVCGATRGRHVCTLPAHHPERTHRDDDPPAGGYFAWPVKPTPLPAPVRDANRVTPAGNQEAVTAAAIAAQDARSRKLRAHLARIRAAEEAARRSTRTTPARVTRQPSTSHPLP